jgi:hypothetical protein
LGLIVIQCTTPEASIFGASVRSVQDFALRSQCPSRGAPKARVDKLTLKPESRKRYEKNDLQNSESATPNDGHHPIGAAFARGAHIVRDRQSGGYCSAVDSGR